MRWFCSRRGIYAGLVCVCMGASVSMWCAARACDP